MASKIFFEENGGTSVTDLTEQTALPNPLPTTTKANHVFAGWYYDNLFTQKANAGDELTTNVTLYAKWYTPTSWCEDIADAIREKEGSSEPIKHVDFADRIETLPSPREEQTKTVSPTTSSQDVLPDANKVLSKVTINAIPTETKSQQPNLSSGNQTINATSGKFMTSFTITKDTINHIASNIRSGKTLYGVTGNMEVSVPVKLGTPTITLSSGIISWSAVTNAVTYIVFKNNAFLSATTGLTYNVSTIVGTYKVKAVASGYVDSNFSNEVVIVLPKPSDLTGTKWKFNNTITFPASSISAESLYGTVSYTGQSPASFDSEQTYFYSCFVGTPTNQTIMLFYTRSGNPTKAAYFLGYNESGHPNKWVLKYTNPASSQYDITIGEISDVFVKFTGGSASTNVNFINWLWSNAKRIE